MVVVGGEGKARLLLPGPPVQLGARIPDTDAVTATVNDDGTLIFTGGPSGIHAWAADGIQRWTSPHPPPYPIDLALSGDGRWLAAAGLDGGARIYRVEDGLLMAVLRGHTARLSALAFAVEKPLLATIGWDAQLHLWDLSVLDMDAQTAASTARTRWQMDWKGALAAVVQ